MLRKLFTATLLALLILAAMVSCAAAAAPPGKMVSNELSGELEATEVRLVTLSWEQAPPATLTVRVPATAEFRCTSATEAEGGRDITKALFILEMLDSDGKPVGPEAFALHYTPLPGGAENPLGWDTAGKFFYFGSRDGFRLTMGWNQATQIRIRALVAGTFTYRLYTVELP